MPLFYDRRDAGKALAHQLAARSIGDALVLGLPRGGVPVAYEVARALGAPLDVLVVRKLGVPGHEELAMGAIASGGVRVTVPDIVEGLRISADTIAGVAAREQVELARRERAYRGGRAFPDIHGRQVIVVDDGVATGASMIAAVRAVRALGAAAVVAAAPVMSRQAYADLAAIADTCEAVSLPEPFHGVGYHYADFSQTTDDEVRELLAASRHDSSPTPDGHLTGPAGGIA